MSLELRGVSRAFGSVRAVDDLTLEAQEGCVLVLLGPNGAGKTTTMRLILGILAPDAGTVRWNGKPVDPQTRKRFAYMPEERGIYPKLRPREQMKYFGELHGLSDLEAGRRADIWIERLGLAQYSGRPCGELSKGNQQKVQFACALLHEPTLAVLDEPFSGLDPQNAAVLIDAIVQARARGATILLSSHQIDQMEDLGDRFAIIDAGRLRRCGTLAELRATSPTVTLHIEPLAAGRAGIAGILGGEVIGEDGDVLVARIPRDTDPGPIARAAAAGGTLARFERREPSLREIYLAATGSQAAFA